MKTVVKRTFIVLVGLVILVALFYAEEDWRGKRAWEKCKAELAAKGVALDWNAYIPPPVSGDQNFFKAPKMQEWFVKTTHYSGTNELTSRMTDPRTGSVGAKTNSIVTEADARNYLAWSDQFEPDFDQVREALKRPYARMDGDYSNPFEIPMPNFVAVRMVAQLLAQRTHCYLLIGQPEKALNELTLLNDSRRLLESAPTGKPVTLVAAMINVAVTGLYVNTIADGLRQHAWQEPQLVAFQEQLIGIHLVPIVAKSFGLESADICWTFGNFLRKYPNDLSFWQRVKHFSFPLYEWMPRGWVYQNMATVAKIDQQIIDSVKLTNNLILPQKVDETQREIESFNNHFNPYTFLVTLVGGGPNEAKAFQFTAYNEAMTSEAQIACALERYRLAHGEYPEKLDVLVPQFIEKLPHDIIGGPPSQGSGAASQPLHYRRTNDGKFLLYSVGWNETDDGGQVVLKENGSVDREKGDWVWPNP